MWVVILIMKGWGGGVIGTALPEEYIFERPCIEAAEEIERHNKRAVDTICIEIPKQ